MNPENLTVEIENDPKALKSWKPYFTRKAFGERLLE